jgi:predicted Zn-dependent protease with MMP-like domain
MRGDLMDKVIPRFKKKYYKIIIKIKYGSQQLFHDFRTKSPKNLLGCFSKSSAQLNLPPESSA